jgi:hypothetical protein
MLSVDADQVFLPLVTAFVENAANCFGLGMDESLMLTLASEEVFMHLCRVVMPAGGPVEIACSNGVYYTKAVFTLPAGAFDMRAFNLTAKISVEDEADLDAMGLIIASRSVDRFLLTHEEGEAPRLTLIKEKAYPKGVEAPPTCAGPPGKTSIRSPRPEEVKFLSQLAAFYYDVRMLPDVFLYPGKVVDMIKAGEYHSLAAVGDAGEIGGAVFWREIGENTVECFGPYVFNRAPAPNIAEELMEGCIGTVARTRAVGIINLSPTPELPRQHFELLGTLDDYARDGSVEPCEAWFRLLREDTGSAVWVHPGLEEFLRREYAKLVLPREIRIDQPSGETLPRHSVLSAEFNRLQGHVVLRPIWPGADAEENIERHVRLLQSEQVLNIHFAVDLGQAWQTLFVPGLLAQGFEPRLVLPYAGKADLVVFQLRGKH